MTMFMAEMIIILLSIALCGLAIMVASVFVDREWLAELGFKLWMVPTFGALAIGFCGLAMEVLAK